MRDLEGLADVVIGVVSRAMAPMAERLAVAESKLAQYAVSDQTIAELRERVVVAETKAALLRPDSDFDAVLIRIAAIESRQAAEREPVAVSPPLPPVPVVSLQDLNALRDRLEFVEAKATGFEMRLASPEPLSATAEKAQRALADAEKTERALADLTKDLGGMRERIAVVETRQPIPGPPGPAGKDGRDGVDGLHGKDGLAGLSFEGVYQEGHSYDKGMLVTWAGSSWHCNEPTATKPGDGSKAWTLMVKRGRDGKDFRETAVTTLPVVSVSKVNG